MYVPKHFAVEGESEIRAMVEAVGSGWLVTVGDGDVPTATLLPVLWSEDHVVAHVARANPQWRGMDGQPALLIVGGPEAYVSPSWYPSKAEHGRVVPTWNYTAVHLTGTVRVHHDPEWLLAVVTALTDRHESGRGEPWRVTDAPPQYVDANLGAIVGIELTVTRFEAKAKLSQNRGEADRRGVIEGLRREGAPGASAIASAVESAPESTER